MVAAVFTRVSGGCSNVHWGVWRLQQCSLGCLAVAAVFTGVSDSCSAVHFLDGHQGSALERGSAVVQDTESLLPWLTVTADGRAD